MPAAYWINKGSSAKEAIEIVREKLPGAIETPEQENSLYELEMRLKNG